MEVTFEKDTHSVTKRYLLTDKEIEIMKFISKHERIDFRELKYGAENPSDTTGTFLVEDCADLMGQGFIEEDENWWNSYVFTALGKYFVEGNPLFQVDETPRENGCYKCGTEIKFSREWGVGYYYCPTCKEDRTKNGEEKK